ncbi:unnamed protein product [Phytophthora fragariaefolia]|uniref:Unnamed protein product n=1 Tax=Phytophthora fragariaefolia TaxID=1490495 RepID=A0A9W6XVS5_9STRA|nr:unnamed protein product [Phytophthora fragariaefolia]
MVNSVTAIMEYAMPLVDDLLTGMEKYLWYCSLDAASGFWAVMMTQRARKISAFVCALGHFVAGLHIRSTTTLVQHALIDTFGWATCSVATIHSRKHYYWEKAIDICQLGAYIRTEILPTTRWQILALSLGGKEKANIQIQFSFSTKRLLISLYLDLTILAELIRPTTDDQPVRMEYERGAENLPVDTNMSTGCPNAAATHVACEDCPHLADPEWEALQRLATVIGEAAVATMLRTLSPTEQHCVALGFNMKGLRDGPVKTYLFREYPSTLEAAITLAMQEGFSLRQAKLHANVPRQMPRPAMKPTGGPEPMDLSSATAAGSQQRRGPTNVRCFWCRNNGHDACECTAPAHAAKDRRGDTGYRHG